MIEEYPEQFMLLVDMEEAFSNVAPAKHQAWIDAGHPLNGRCKNTLEDGSRCNTKPIHGEDMCEGCGCEYDGVRRAPAGMWAANYWTGEGTRQGPQRLIQRAGPDGGLKSIPEWYDHIIQEVA